MTLKIADSPDDCLLRACEDGDYAMAVAALEAGAVTSSRFPGEPSPLIYAADSGSLALVELLLKARADAEYRDDERSSALVEAAVIGHHAIAALLISHGATDSPNRYGVRPSDYAQHHGHPELAKLILISCPPPTELSGPRWLWWLRRWLSG
jgi:uncharacterized protein